tara:strand:- start:195 stop:893 length:699 start_codon:yes stop_codon:yes gene_type:complete
MGLIKAYHLLTRPETDREQASINSISELGELDGVEYTQVVNPPFTDLPPKDSCARPRDVGMEPGHNPSTGGYYLSPGHYGCYRAHADAIMSLPEDTEDMFLIFECDAILIPEPATFTEYVKKANELSLNRDLNFFSFGRPFGDVVEFERHQEAGSFIEAHAYLIPGSKLTRIKEVLDTTKWDVFDLWATYNFKVPVGYFYHYTAIQGDGYSLLDKQEVSKYPEVQSRLSAGK